MVGLEQKLLVVLQKVHTIGYLYFGSNGAPILVDKSHRHSPDHLIDGKDLKKLLDKCTMPHRLPILVKRVTNYESFDMFVLNYISKRPLQTLLVKALCVLGVNNKSLKWLRGNELFVGDGNSEVFAANIDPHEPGNWIVLFQVLHPALQCLVSHVLRKM